MALTTIEYTYTNQTSFAIPFALGILHRDYVFVQLNGETYATNDGQAPLEYTDFDWISDSEITINGLTGGDVVKIYRRIPRNELITSFEEGADITRTSLDNQAKQAMMLIQEVTDTIEQFPKDFANSLLLGTPNGLEFEAIGVGSPDDRSQTITGWDGAGNFKNFTFQELTSLIGDVSGIKQEVLDEVFQALSEGQFDFDSAIAALSSAVYNSVIAYTDTAFAALEAADQQLTNDIASANTALSNALDTVETTVVAQGVSIGNNQTAIAGEISRVDTIQVSVDDNATAITNVSSATSTNATEIASLTSRTSDTEAAVISAAAVGSANASNLTAVSLVADDAAQRVTTQESVTTGQASQIASINSTLGTNSASITALNTATTTLDTDLNAVEVAASALTSIVAKAGNNAINKESNFASGNTAAAYPHGQWFTNSGGTIPNTFVSGLVSDNAMQLTKAAGSTAYIQQTTATGSISEGSYIIGATLKLISGSYDGAKIRLYFYKDDGTYLSYKEVTIKGAEGQGPQENNPPPLGARHDFQTVTTAPANAGKVVIQFGLFSASSVASTMEVHECYIAPAGLRSNLSSILGFRVKAGTSGAEFTLAALDGTDATGSVARISADNLILDGTLQAVHFASGSIFNISHQFDNDVVSKANSTAVVQQWINCTGNHPVRVDVDLEFVWHNAANPTYATGDTTKAITTMLLYRYSQLNAEWTVITSGRLCGKDTVEASEIFNDVGAYNGSLVLVDDGPTTGNCLYRVDLATDISYETAGGGVRPLDIKVKDRALLCTEIRN